MTPKIAVLGGRKLSSRKASLIAYALGDAIAAHGYQLFTGGVSGAGEEASRGAYRHLQNMGEPPLDRITSVVPHGFQPSHPYGRTLHRGKNWEERRRELVKIADIFIVIGGGEGTRQEISFAVGEGKPLIPIACTGGEAALLWQKLYESGESPVGREHLWKLRPEVNDPLVIKKEVLRILSLLAGKTV
ncbi:MAG: hypothetical protein OEZ30_00020 [Candidatus Aminicenantes bacterium]|nr:hypothetical protein [Candidatus Aminicenantes bacterium]MDH5713934.1 hypothetical protein [Candidatus Aminicenantes bacterium]